MEVEAKFSVPNAKVYRRLARLHRLAHYAIMPRGTLTQRDRYMDTADGAVTAGGYACRLRTEGESIVATLKGLGTSAGQGAGQGAGSGAGSGAGQGAIHRRDEREVELPSWEANPAVWPESPARTLALELTAGQPLEPLFDITQKRLKADLMDGERLVAEWSLDQVHVDLPDQPVSYHELEIELKGDGVEDDLEVVQGVLTSEWGLEPETRSKFERGFAIYCSGDYPLSSRVSIEEKAELEVGLAGAAEPARRAAAILGWASGLSISAIAARTGLSRTGVRYWIRLFRDRRTAILTDGSGGEKAKGRKAARAEMQDAVCDGTPPPPTPAAAEEGRGVSTTAPSPAAHLSRDEGAGAGEGGGGGPARSLPQPVPIEADEPMSEAGRKIMQLHFARVEYHEPGTRSGEDPESLHDMRVATRRLRAAFLLFEPYYKPSALAPFNKQLRSTGRMLGAVRDMDVLLGKARAYAAEQPVGRPDIDPLLAAWDAERAAGRDKLIEFLNSGKHAKFTEKFGAFLATPCAGARAMEPGEPVPHLVNHVAGRLLFQRYETVRAYDGVLAGAPLATYHRLRIDCKRFRYALEFFRDVLGPEAALLIKQVTTMQDLLGDLQDSTVTEGLIGGFLQDEIARHLTDRQRMPLEGVVAYLAHQWTIQRELLAKFPDLWAKLIGPDFRRNFGLAVAAL